MQQHQLAAGEERRAQDRVTARRVEERDREQRGLLRRGRIRRRDRLAAAQEGARPAEQRRTELNHAMARIFDPADGVDFVVTASNPDVAFDADGPLPSVFGGLEAGRGNNGQLTFPANLHGNPAISIPAGSIDGLPIGLQIVGRHFSEPLLLDLALTMERNRPWPLTAPSAV